MTVIPDGRHDVLVVDAQTDEMGSVHLELAVTTGPNKGDVVRLVMTAAPGSGGEPVPGGGASRDPIDLLGLPGTLVVEDGRPRLTLD